MYTHIYIVTAKSLDILTNNLTDLLRGNYIRGDHLQCCSCFYVSVILLYGPQSCYHHL